MTKKQRRAQERDRQRQRNNRPTPQGNTLPLPSVSQGQRGEDTQSDIRYKEGQSLNQTQGIWELWTRLKRASLVIKIIASLGGVGIVAWVSGALDLWNISVQQSQVDAARQQIEVSKQSMVLPNRPRFALQPVRRPPLVVGQPIRIEMVWKNVGHSEALNTEPCWYHYIADLPDESFVAPSPCPEEERMKLMPAIQHVPVVPNNIVKMPFVITLTEEELRQIREKKAALYLYGEMHYRDFAKNTYPLSFCFFLAGEEDGSFGVCPKGNVNE